MNPRGWVEIILALAIFAAPLALLVQRARAKEGQPRGLGVRTIQFLGTATFAPALIILAFERVIDGCTVAALVGAFVGYLFSGLAEFDRRRSDQ